ncbi:DUF3231 family protein [Neobacillus jeddahensis]|uniref:DUF3231 family protein n=1 Tax=Neobacillus jeddahensis TaxID=1461580 RepID=UPI00058DD5BC|nr:DUF3231 family protein [Neobacillus jeddahensis]
MTNMFESMKDLFVPIVDGMDKHPLHIGEVSHLWLLLTLIEEGIIVYQLGLNTTTDPDLIHALTNGEQSAKEVAKRLRNFFIKEGVPLPAASEDKPKSDPNSVPLGVKYTDRELANLVSTKIAAEITLIGQGIGVCIRNDACQMLFQIQVELFKYGSSFKNMMKKRGWIITPPFYSPPGSPQDTTK